MTALAVAELLAIILAYQLVAMFECRQTDIAMLCRAVRSMPARGLAVIVVIGLFFWLRPESYRALVARIGARPGRPFWLAVHAAGIGLIFAPFLAFGPDGIVASFGATLPLLVVGGMLAAAGGLFWVLPARDWVNWLRGDRYYLPLLLAGAFMVPDLAEAIQPLWYRFGLKDLTFALVYAVLVATGADARADPDLLVIGMEGFYVQVGQPCAGVEGIALITLFMGLYALLMRGNLRQGRFWLALYPLAVLASWVLNILRIALLILIGARLSPEHALNGFHSYAGWLMFTVIALCVVAVAHRIGWFHRAAPAERRAPPLNQDEIAASIVPFIAMMLSGVVVAAFWPEPEAGYPLRVALTLLPLIYFRPVLVRIGWRITPVDILTGAVIGGLWIASGEWLAPSPEPGRAATVGQAGGALWLAARLLWTVAIVPVVEELFFRNYLLRRLDLGGPAWRVLALVVSALLFGLMHQRIVAGTLAGLAFGALMLHRRSLAAPVAAHVTANAAIALWEMAALYQLAD